MDSAADLRSDWIRSLARVEAKEISAGRPATELFIGWANIERAMTEELIEAGRRMYEEYLKKLDRIARG